MDRLINIKFNLFMKNTATTSSMQMYVNTRRTCGVEMFCSELLNISITIM